MAHFHCFIGEQTLNLNSLYELPPSETLHLHVARAKMGDPLTLLTGNGASYSALLQTLTRHKAIAHIHQHTHFPKPKPEVILLQGVPAQKQFDWMIQKATEIGVSEIHPVLTEYTTWQSIPDNLDHKQERWRQIAIEACKQSRNPYLPHIAPIQPLNLALKSLPTEKTLRLVAHLTPEAKHLSRLMHEVPLKAPQCVVLAVGPEGGFSSADAGCLIRNVFQPLKLTETILRAETAALYGLSILNAYFHENQ